MKINQNMSALRANSHMLHTEKKLSASIERLSSGYKLNKPGDNPAGMAISNKMRAQINALGKASDNVSDAISVMQIADGALNEVTSMLQRMRELSVQAANETNSYQDKKSIQMEIEQLAKEVDRISTDTEYNKKTLLNGYSDVRTYATPNSATRIATSATVTAGEYSLEITDSAKKGNMEINVNSLFSQDAQGNDVINKAYGGQQLSLNGVGVSLEAGMSRVQFFEQIRNAAEEAGIEAKESSGTISLSTTRYGSSAEIRLEADLTLAGAIQPIDMSLKNPQSPEIDTATSKYKLTSFGENAEVNISPDKKYGGVDETGFTSTATVNCEGNRIKITDFNGFSIDFLLDENYKPQDVKGTFTLEVTEIGDMTIQSGGNQYQTMNLAIPEISKNTLYLDTVNVTVVEGASRAMSTLDDAIARLSEVRSQIGSFQNRLEYAANSLSETEEDMTSAFSRLLDTDMATEMVEYTQQSVLQQAATSVLSQANDLPQTVLQMLQ